MPPPLLFDVSHIDFNRVLLDIPAIERINPQCYEMRQLDGIVHLDPDAMQFVGFKNIRDDEFWVRGHIPGRPLFPGVLMIEAAAQLASLGARQITNENRFIGFGGVKDVKFRAQIVPGQRLILLGKFLEFRPRRCKMAVQGIVEDQLAFEGLIIGMPM